MNKQILHARLKWNTIISRVNTVADEHYAICADNVFKFNKAQPGWQLYQRCMENTELVKSAKQMFIDDLMARGLLGSRN